MAAARLTGLAIIFCTFCRLQHLPNKNDFLSLSVQLTLLRSFDKCSTAQKKTL